MPLAAAALALASALVACDARGSGGSDAPAPARATAARVEPPPSASGWSAAAEEVAEALEEACARAVEGEDAAACELAVWDGYYGRFEPPDRNLEAAIGQNLGRERVALAEEMFRGLARALRERRPPHVVRGLLEELIERVRADAAELDRAGVPLG